MQSPELVVVDLDRPRDGVPEVTATLPDLDQLIGRFAAGSGPVAVDAERASGHRYGQRAFLVQLRRAGSGTALIDPEALPDLSALGRALAGTEWIIHAASQDLPCLAELGMRPERLFDTELGGRIAGLPKVGLAAMVEDLLGLRLAKEHSAVDWSTRPLPLPWLVYASLDVEVLVELRDAVAARLAEQGKLEWAGEEFQALLDAPAAPARTDPWRRTSGMHRIRSRRQLAVVRELWNQRDELARQADTAPGRLLPDAAIVDAAVAAARRPVDLATLPTFTGRGARRRLPAWKAAVQRALDLPEDDLPPQQVPGDGPPPPRLWKDRDPAAAARLEAARTTLRRLAARQALPVENLLSPDAVRRLAWGGPGSSARRPATPEAVDAFLTERGARSWQRALTVEALAGALTDPASVPPDEPAAEPQDGTAGAVPSADEDRPGTPMG